MKRMDRIEADDVKQISIESYLRDRGVTFEKRGGRLICSSPFCRDSNWSFTLYPGNTFFDWAMGFGGTIIDLVMKMEDVSFIDALRHLKGGEFKEYKPNYKETRKRVDKFDIERYTTTDPYNVLTIDGYAHGRDIRHEYLHGVFFQKYEDLWIEIPSIMFPHRDENLEIIGARFRAVPSPDLTHFFGTTKLFSSRGRMGWYVLEHINSWYDDPTLYIVESETSANSLWEFFRRIDKSAVVLSAGAVGCMPEIPKKYSSLSEVQVIIDFDGDEDLWRQRIQPYQDYFDRQKMTQYYPVLRLEKGEDINSLFSNSKMYLIQDLLI